MYQFKKKIEFSFALSPLLRHSDEKARSADGKAPWRFPKILFNCKMKLKISLSKLYQCLTRFPIAPNGQTIYD